MNFQPFFTTAQQLFKNKLAITSPDIDSQVSDHEKTLVLDDQGLELSPPEKLPSEIERKYQIRRTLGKGAFGIVYLAEDRKIGRLVAIKQLLKPFAKNPEIYERFTQEARIGAQLDHPNIINVFALEEDKNSACIIMEYLGGGSLASYIQKEKRLDLMTSLKIILGVLNGLEAAHHIMVIHRDIKPQNILFGARGEPKISDFGVAHLPENAGGSHSISDDMTRNIVGTPMYMAPEQILKKQVDNRADIYSAGAVLYEMLSGRKIFSFDSSWDSNQIIETVVSKIPEPLEPELKIPSEITAIVEKMLAKNPDDRFQNAREIISLIQAFIENEKPPASATGSNLVTGTIGTVGPVLTSPAAMLEDVIRLFLIDGSLSAAERKELDRRAERLGVSKIQAEALEDKVREELGLPSLKSLWEFTQLVEAFLATSKEPELSEEQLAFLHAKGREFNIRKKERLSIIQDCRDKAYYMKYKRL